MRIVIGVIAGLLLLLVLSTTLYTVDRSDYVYVTQFGRHVVTRDGQGEGGLHFKLPWPVQSVQRLDRRLQYFDLPETELLTPDSQGQTIDKTLLVAAYVCWRVPDAKNVDLFIRRLGTPERARTILGERIRSQLGALLSKKRMDDLISTDADKVHKTLEELRDSLCKAGSGLAALARTEYGVELVDVRLRRTSHPLAVRQSIFERIQSERNKRVANYQSEGALEAAKIRSEGERKARDILADARATEQRLKGDAEAQADQIRNLAHGKDPEFYAFLKKLEEYQRILGDKSVLLLSTHRGLFDTLLQPPKPTAPVTKPQSPPKGEK
ncbi:MAG TPA: protease modulator HflC [Gemmataceae bacterium]|nr:protease modulator HflC [Gemmataceae bacterium]